MIWGTDIGKIEEERLSKLGLQCWGGSSNKYGEMTYHVFNDDKSFDKELAFNEFNNIEIVYKNFLKEMRKNKLEKLKND